MPLHPARLVSNSSPGLNPSKLSPASIGAPTVTVCPYASLEVNSNPPCHSTSISVVGLLDIFPTQTWIPASPSACATSERRTTPKGIAAPTVGTAMLAAEPDPVNTLGGRAPLQLSRVTRGKEGDRGMVERVSKQPASGAKGAVQHPRRAAFLTARTTYLIMCPTDTRVRSLHPVRTWLNNRVDPIPLRTIRSLERRTRWLEKI